MAKKFSFKSFVWDASDIKDIYEKNEIKANHSSAVACFNLAFLAIFAVLLSFTGLYKLSNNTILYSIIGAVELLVPAIVASIKKGRGKYLKYILLLGILLGITVAYIFNDATIMLLYVIPIALSCRYSNKKFVLLVSGLTIFFFLGGTVGGIFTGIFYPNNIEFNELTILNLYPEMSISEAVVKELGYGPVFATVFSTFGLINVLIIAVISYICFENAARGKELLMEEVDIIKNEARISSELNLATSIQANMLPNIFPPFPDHSEFDIYAAMVPAKEVGGDFYDFFMVDDIHVAIVIGDVSGKGVPAALFMVTAKTLIKDHTQMGLHPSEVFTKVNNILCQGNEAGLFVTGWMASINIMTGVMTYVNAGHNPPVLLQNGKFAPLLSKPGFVLAGLDGITYREEKIQLNKGDRIFLYTDGITEATTEDKKLYGEKRLVDFLNKNKDLPIKDLVDGIYKDANEFVGKAEQFDDMTTLMFEYINNRLCIENVFDADVNSLDKALEFVLGELKNNNVAESICNQISIAFEEIFVNVAHYAYKGRKGKTKVELKFNDRDVQILIKDNGVPFNPLTRVDPDVTLNAEERDIGGLGIFMAKKLMDSVEYEYKEGMNIVTLTKVIKE